jgi:hypothetical protein
MVAVRMTFVGFVVLKLANFQPDEKVISILRWTVGCVKGVLTGFGGICLYIVSEDVLRLAVDSIVSEIVLRLGVDPAALASTPPPCAAGRACEESLCLAESLRGAPGLRGAGPPVSQHPPLVLRYRLRTSDREGGHSLASYKCSSLSQN